jgi:CheY-like chemotaxis protein
MGVKRLVLVVEDFPETREDMCAWLEGDGFEVRAAADYHSALRELEAATPSLACIDLTLPRESGFDLIEAIRKMPGRALLPLMVISERAYPEDMAQAEELGANAFLKKPFTRERFLKYVHAILDGPFSSRPSVRRLQPID